MLASSKSGLRAVLFDLDGTLLGNDLDVFLPRYFEALSSRVSDLVPAKEFVRHLLAATSVMLANDGRDTNEEVFAAAFYPAIGQPRTRLEPVFLDFYQHEYRLLERYTARRPEARPVVEAALDLGYDVVIATNPLFPGVAIHQRLAWAGVGDLPYRLVTTYENSRACKPNPRYYRGILEAIDCPPQAALMVGNEPGDLAAAAVGCSTYLVTDGSRGTQETAPTYSGPLSALPDLLRKQRG